MISCGNLHAAVVAFDFAFYDTTSVQIGSGVVSFEDYSGSGSSIKSFRSVAQYSWQFDIQSAGIAISSSQGDGITLGPIQSQGFVIQQAGNSTKSLSFFDRTGSGIFASDNLGGIRFTSLSNNVDFISNGEFVGSGYFTALSESQS